MDTASVDNYFYLTPKNIKDEEKNEEIIKTKEYKLSTKNNDIYIIRINKTKNHIYLQGIPKNEEELVFCLYESKFNL